MAPNLVCSTRRKRQWVLSPSPDFSLHTGNKIINRLVDRVLKLEPGAKVDYKFFRGQPKIAKARITDTYFTIVVMYHPPYGMQPDLMAAPPAEITAELSVDPSKQYDQKKYESIADIVRKL